jgi:hypothetical protein
MKLAILAIVLCAAPAGAQEDLSKQLLKLKRVYVDRLTGGETAAQMRDLIITSLSNSKLFVVTENEERADAVMRGAAEDLIYTDQFSSSDGIDLRAAASRGTRSTSPGTTTRSASASVGDNESTNIHERKHEAFATVRLVNKDGDVIWSTTQESNGAKFRGASADVADKITKQLAADFDLARKGPP